MKRPLAFDTLSVHAAQDHASWEGATRAPIHQSASYGFERAEDLSDAFAGKSAAHFYSRLSNPTVRTLEEKIAVLEDAPKATATASGMAAVSGVVLALARAGDEIVAGRSLFVSTHALFNKLLPRFGVATRLVDPCDPEAVAAAITGKTRLVYLETIGNPALDVPDIAHAARAAHAAGVPLAVDNTLASPYLCRPAALGADIVIHSTTKYLSGHGQALGGVVVDAGNFDWAASGRFADFAPFVDAAGPLAFTRKLVAEIQANIGAAAAPMHAYLTMLGMDTLGLRMRRHQENAAAAAEFLAARPEVAWVNYPGLPDHPSHATAADQFQGRGYGALVTFGLKSAGRAAAFQDNLELVTTLANLGDCKTLVIHPRSTQYCTLDGAVCDELGIAPEMLRLSLGIEDASDILADLARGLEAVR